MRGERAGHCLTAEQIIILLIVNTKKVVFSQLHFDVFFFLFSVSIISEYFAFNDFFTSVLKMLFPHR